MLQQDTIREWLDRGEHWRAKEHLQGRLSAPGYDPELYETYGNVLLEMNDTLEAGKYLFLSGAREESYAAAISLFLRRHGEKGGRQLFHTFPKSAQASEISEYPDQVRKELEEMGISPSELRTGSKRHDFQQRSALEDNVIAGTIMVVFLLLLVGFLISAFRGLAWLFTAVVGGA